MNSENENKPEDKKNERDEEWFLEHRRRHRRAAWKFPLVFAVVLLVKGALVMLLWNNLIPELFHGPEVNFLQAIGLVVLAKLLIGFKGMHNFPGYAGRHDSRWHRHWAKMSAEEREKVREHLKHHRHCHHR